jgi:hypothetical protein
MIAEFFNKIYVQLSNWISSLFRKTGRIPLFDERSKDYPVILDGVPTELRSVMWRRNLPALDQGRKSSCTGNAVVGALATEPNVSDGIADRITFNQQLAIDIYSKATTLDKFGWTYPPTDRGSSCLAAMKAAKAMGLIKQYRWCFGIQDILRTLSYIGPVITGINWYSGFNRPDSSGEIHLSGEKTGGHAIQLIGIDVENQKVWAVNSWGSRWGIQGRFCISFQLMERLLKERGEGVVAIL